MKIFLCSKDYYRSKLFNPCSGLVGSATPDFGEFLLKVQNFPFFPFRSKKNLNRVGSKSTRVSLLFAVGQKYAQAVRSGPISSRNAINIFIRVPPKSLNGHCRLRLWCNEFFPNTVFAPTSSQISKIPNPIFFQNWSQGSGSILGLGKYRT